MAAPASVTLDDLSGKYVMNSTLSDPIDPILKFQGIGYITRSAIYYATITLAIKHYTAPSTSSTPQTTIPPTDPDQVPRIDITQTLTGGFKGTAEHRIADNTPRTHTDHVFGTVTGRSLFLPIADVGKDAKDASYLSEADQRFLVSGWDADITSTGRIFLNYVEAEQGGWVAWGTWGFETVDGVRRYARRQVVRKPKTGESMVLRLFYDYLGSVEEAAEEEEAEEEDTGAGAQEERKKVGEDYVSDI